MFLEITGTHLQDTWCHNPEGKGKFFPMHAMKVYGEVDV